MAVYFAQPLGGGPIKIGVSKDPVRRVRSLSGPSGIPIEIKATAPGGVFLEGYLHYKFRVHRLRWEWFRPVPEIYELIEAVRVNGHVPGAPDEAEYGQCLATMVVDLQRRRGLSDVDLANGMGVAASTVVQWRGFRGVFRSKSVGRLVAFAEAAA